MDSNGEFMMSCASNRGREGQELVLAVSLTRGWRVPMESPNICCCIPSDWPVQRYINAVSHAKAKVTVGYALGGHWARQGCAMSCEMSCAQACPSITMFDRDVRRRAHDGRTQDSLGIHLKLDFSPTSRSQFQRYYDPPHCKDIWNIPVLRTMVDVL